ncbi:RNA polymerase II-associated protein 1 [Diutina catenulata]
MSKPVRQDYIAKVRYQNNLPPPPLNPKFLHYHLTEPTSQKREGDQLMSSLFRSENFTALMAHPELPLNLIHNTGFLEEEKVAAVGSAVDGGPAKLHPADRELLRDAGITNLDKSEPGVSFLRRTEYIAEKQISTASQAAPKQKEEDKVDPESQLAAVEATFDAANDTLHHLEHLKHPRRKQLVAKRTWPLLPDTSMADQKFLNVKFIGSASVSRELGPEKYQEAGDQLRTAIFRPITSADGEWISLFEVADGDTARELASKLNSKEKEQPERSEESEFTFRHQKNYDMRFTRNPKPNEELAIKFATEGGKRKAAYYYPVSGRIDLKKYRTSTNTEVNRFLRDSTIDQINFKLREPSTDELRKSDAVRSEYDPMEYEADDDEAEDDLDEHFAES